MEKREPSSEHQDVFHPKPALSPGDTGTIVEEILNVHSTPEEERKVLLKLDLLYCHHCTILLLNLTRG